ncbi:MAG: DEAD/DEAH box helicase [Deltaproteobacteria bacterium]|nr:DEAD/DEAH box helicase [Deltaproteobacteria bacterium]
MTQPSSLEPETAAPDFLSLALASITRRGFASLTEVQQAVLAPDLEGCDLRISSRTGSGKTVAVGLVIAREMAPITPSQSTGWRPARPQVILIAPTRELAAQVAAELGWLFAGSGARVAPVTGGTRIDEELRALGRDPTVVVGTPGRLLDHLQRGSVDASSVRTVVLDEADQMLDLGFRDELDAILEKIPADRRSHLVSATFPQPVLALAERYQRDARRVEGTALGVAHADITHVAHLVLPDERGLALVNLLRMTPGERTLVFVRTRADASDVAAELDRRGFSVAALSGELEQRERSRTLDAFRRGDLLTIVATDVAARGLDVPDVARVVHFDPPEDAELYTHRSGRTGRAGRKGTSIVLCPRPAYERVLRVLRSAGVSPTWRPAPSAADVVRVSHDRFRESLETTEPLSDDGRRAFAETLLSQMDPVALVAALLDRVPEIAAGGEEVTPVPVPERRGAPHQAHRAVRPGAVPFTRFRINWGERNGADPRRVLALVCRRGGISSSEIGAIHIGPSTSVIEVTQRSATSFARSVKRPDARDRRTYITPA